MPEIFVSWSEYNQKIEQLATKIYDSGWEFNQILCLARGGLRVGDILSRIYNLPLAILAASSYTISGEQGKLKLASAITSASATLGDKILLVDDLVDSGVTLQQTLNWLKNHQEYSIEQVKTAVIWYKSSSSIEPDFYVDFLTDHGWIHQPFEIYDRMHPSDLKIVNEEIKEIQIPDSLQQSLYDLANRDGISIDRFISSAIAEKLSALMTENYLKERAESGNRLKYEAILAKVPDIDPEPYDRIPTS